MADNFAFMLQVLTQTGSTASRNPLTLTPWPQWSTPTTTWTPSTSRTPPTSWTSSSWRVGSWCGRSRWPAPRRLTSPDSEGAAGTHPPQPAVRLRGGSAPHPLCPKHAMARHISRLRRRGAVPDSPLFPNDQRASPIHALDVEGRQMDRFGGHVARVSAQFLAANGIPVTTVQLLRRWSSKPLSATCRRPPFAEHTWCQVRPGRQHAESDTAQTPGWGGRATTGTAWWDGTSRRRRRATPHHQRVDSVARLARTAQTTRDFPENPKAFN